MLPPFPLEEREVTHDLLVCDTSLYHCVGERVVAGVCEEENTYIHSDTHTYYQTAYSCCGYIYVYEFVCVCVRERERERARARVRTR